ncbi:PDR/VanB family oxidoreductase [Paraburkholderia graminis]|uniref:PDR/VanB family oxidoreductase n=1 Tax=Paraburkholderia graminis TaxID=60548 RepID=UPI0038B8CFA4
MDIAAVWQDLELSLLVTERRVEAGDIVAFELERPDGSELPPFEAGAHVLVEAAPGIRRAYSLCGDPADRCRYILAVQRESVSRGGSAALHDRLHLGMSLRMTRPRNDFPLQEGARRSVLLAGGIGVAPLLAMAERLFSLRSDFVLHYCIRSPERMAFARRLARSGFEHHVHVHHDHGAVPHRFNAASVLAVPEHEIEGTHVYVCGPAGFIDHVMGAAQQYGWGAAQLHREYFPFPSEATDASDEATFDLVLASNGQRIHVGPGKSAARALQKAGIPLLLSCGEGICGTCVTTVLPRQPDHRDHYLTGDDRRRDDCFMPCCSRAQTNELVIDL